MPRPPQRGPRHPRPRQALAEHRRRPGGGEPERQRCRAPDDRHGRERAGHHRPPASAQLDALRVSGSTGAEAVAVTQTRSSAVLDRAARAGHRVGDGGVHPLVGLAARREACRVGHGILQPHLARARAERADPEREHEHDGREGHRELGDDRPAVVAATASRDGECAAHEIGEDAAHLVDCA